MHLSIIQGTQMELFGQTAKCIKSSFAAGTKICINLGGVCAAFIEVFVHREDPRPAAAARQDEARLGQVRGRGLQSRCGEEGAAARVRPRQGRVRDSLRHLRGTQKGSQLLSRVVAGSIFYLDRLLMLVHCTFKPVCCRWF